MTIKKKHCPIHKIEMKQKFNSTIFSCPLCDKEKANAMMKRSYLKKKTAKKPIKIKKEGLTTKQLEKQLDKAWSLLVKLRAGMKCEYCGTKKTLNSHHIYSRGKKSLRWNVINGICLCVGHHIGLKFSAHKTDIDFVIWLIKYRGEQAINLLRIQSIQTSHFMYHEKIIMLNELKKQIKKLQ